jgi:hypothetical protein
MPGSSSGDTDSRFAANIRYPSAARRPAEGVAAEADSDSDWGAEADSVC